MNVISPRVVIIQCKLIKFKNFEAAKFCGDLNAKLESRMNLSPEINPVNFNLEFDKFNECILSVINRHAPFSAVSRKHKRLLQKPWKTKDIFTSIRHKQKLYNTQLLTTKVETH